MYNPYLPSPDPITDPNRHTPPQKPEHTKKSSSLTKLFKGILTEEADNGDLLLLLILLLIFTEDRKNDIELWITLGLALIL